MCSLNKNLTPKKSTSGGNRREQYSPFRTSISDASVWGFRHLKRLATATTAKTALATVAPISLETALIYAIPDVTSTKPHNFFLLRNFLPGFKRIETHRCHNGLSGSRLKLRLFRSSEHLNRVHRETTLLLGRACLGFGGQAGKWGGLLKFCAQDPVRSGHTTDKHDWREVRRAIFSVSAFPTITKTCPNQRGAAACGRTLRVNKNLHGGNWGSSKIFRRQRPTTKCE